MSKPSEKVVAKLPSTRASVASTASTSTAVESSVAAATRSAKDSKSSIETTTLASGLVKSYVKQDRHLYPHVFFAVVDLKIDKHGKVKILEFGHGHASDLLNKGLSLKKVDELVQKRCRLPLYSTPTILDREQIVLEEPSSKPRRFSDYRCFHALQHGEAFFNFQDTRVLMANNSETFGMVVQNKPFMHEIFKQAKRINDRPECITIVPNYRPGLAKEIQSSLPAERYVLKAAISTRGDGVFVVESQELDLALQVLLASPEQFEEALKKYREHFSSRRKKEELEKEIQCIEKWWKESHQFPEILIEEYCQSKHEIFCQKYESTIRAEVFISISDEGVFFDGIDCYWHATDGFYGADTVTRQLVFSQLEPIMRDIFKTIINFDLHQYVEDSVSHPKLTDQAIYLIMDYLILLNDLHLHDKAIRVGSKFIEFIRKNAGFSRCHFLQDLGVACFFDGLMKQDIDSYFEALVMFNTAIEASGEYESKPRFLYTLHFSRIMLIQEMELALKTNSDDKYKHLRDSIKLEPQDTEVLSSLELKIGKDNLKSFEPLTQIEGRFRSHQELIRAKKQLADIKLVKAASEGNEQLFYLYKYKHKANNPSAEALMLSHVISKSKSPFFMI